MRFISSLRNFIRIILILINLSAYSQVDDNRRLSGFAEHKKYQKKFDAFRESKVNEFIKEKEQEEKEREQAAENYRKKKKLAHNLEEGPEYQEYLREVRHRQQRYHEATEEYKREKALDRAKIEKRHLSEEEELGLNEENPRYDYSKRCIYGGYSKLCKKLAGPGGANSGSGSAGRFGGGNSSSGGGGFPPPPPPTFDDFGDDYIPPPNFSEDGELLPPPPPMMNDDFGDSPLPPPPPLPPLPGDGDF